jgi:hypothetical protein
MAKAPKTTVFLSHIAEEAELGAILKVSLERDFLSMVNIFVSSHSDSLRPGAKWLQQVDIELTKAAVLIVLASPISVQRAWVNFEAGAGWSKNVPVIPLCHSGMTPGGLPLPLGLLQAFQASDAAKLRELYKVIADAMGCSVPALDGSALVAEIVQFEAAYGLETSALVELRAIRSKVPDLLGAMRQLAPATPTTIKNVPQVLIQRVEENLHRLQQRRLIQYTYGVDGIGFGPNSGGAFGSLTIAVEPIISEAIKRSEFS